MPVRGFALELAGAGLGEDTLLLISVGAAATAGADFACLSLLAALFTGVVLADLETAKGLDSTAVLRGAFGELPLTFTADFFATGFAILAAG